MVGAYSMWVGVKDGNEIVCVGMTIIFSWDNHDISL